MSNNPDSWSQSKGKPTSGGGSKRTPHEVTTGASFIKKKLEVKDEPDMYFLNRAKHEMVPSVSKEKGYHYTYPLPKVARENPKIQEMTVMNITNSFMASSMLIK